MNKKILKRNLICVFVTALVAVMMLTVGVMAETYEVSNETDLRNTIASVNNGDVITLKYSVDLGSTALNISTGTSFTLDLGGCTLTGRVNIKGGTDVTIQNGTMTYPGGQPLNVYASGDSSDPTTVLISSSVVIYSSAYGLCVFPADNTNSGEGINITVNGNITSGCGIFVNGLIKSCSSTDIITVNSNVVGTDDDGVGIALNGAKNLVVSSTAVVSGPTGVEVRAGNLTVEDGATITATATEFDIEANGNGTTSLGAGIAVVQHTTKLPITVTVEGGTISGVYAIYEYDIQGNNDEADIAIVVEGGTLTGSTAAISTETENLTVSGAAEVEVSSTNLVAEVNGYMYTSLQAAINAAGTTSSTVTLLQDTTEDVVIDDDQTIILDLNGNTLTNSSEHTITNYGTLTVIDSAGGGTVDNVTHAKAALVNYGTAYLEGGTFTRSSEAGSSSSDNGGNSYYTVKNYNQMSISGATIENSGCYSSCVANGYQNTSDMNSAVAITGTVTPTLTINSGTITGGINSVKNDDYAVLIINGGTITNDNGIGVQNHSTATINGGTITGSTYAVYNCGCNSTADVGILTITGGTFTGGTYALIDVSTASTAEVTISGGTFTGDTAAVTKSTDSVATIAISGGSFSSDVTPYLATGYQVTWSEANEAYIVNAVTTIIGPFYMNEYYHGMLINGTLTTFLHTVNDEGYCTTCGGYIGVETGEVVEETVEIEDPVEGTDTVTEDDGEEESSAIETPVDTETETNPTTGMAIAFLPMAMAALAAVVTKK